MNRCFTLLAATLTLTAACGDNNYVPVEVDDDSTVDFERYTVNPNGYVLSDDYVAPDSIFSYAQNLVTEQADFMREVGALGAYDSDRFTDDSGLDLIDLNDIKWDAIYPVDRFGDVTGTPHDLVDSNPTAIVAQRCNSFSQAPAGPNDVEGDRPSERAPEGIEAETSTGQNLASIDEREMQDDRATCNDAVDNGDSPGVCECSDLDCVAGFVNSVMGCDVCMTFVCGDDLIGACAACTP